MPIPGPESMNDVIATTNIKMFGDAGSMLPLTSSQNATAHQNRMNVLAESIHAMHANKMASTDPVEAASIQKVLTGHDGQQGVISAAFAQIAAKLGQSTPPVYVKASE